MGLSANCKKHILKFTFEAGTSRGVLKERPTYLIKVEDSHHPGLTGWGEAAPLAGLSIDAHPDLEKFIFSFAEEFSLLRLPSTEGEVLRMVRIIVPDEFPSVRMAFETAFLDLLNGGRKVIFDNYFAEGKKSIQTNGLIWMGSKDFMLQQIEDKLGQGFQCLKLKIGALDFDQECEILAYIRQKKGAGQLSLRLDANGAFGAEDIMGKLERLAAYDIHSIEQPISKGQRETMCYVCENSPIPIALDEELIGNYPFKEKESLLEQIKPQYIVLKPSLLGGFYQCNEWIQLAKRKNIGWWITSALESNVGLNAIAQFTAQFDNPLVQGLGTGMLYENNFVSPLEMQNEWLRFHSGKTWDPQLN